MPDNPFGNFRPRQPRPEPEPEREEAPLATTEDNLPAVADAPNELIEEVLIHRDLNPEQIEKLTTWVNRQDLGLSVASGPLVCREGCPHKDVCPLYKDNIHPLNKDCPIEASLMLRWKRKWAKSLGMDLDEDNDAFDLKMLDDLASMSMLKRRAMVEMATENPEIAEKVIGGYVDDMPIEKVYLNPRVQLIERLSKLEIKIYQELLATRKSKFQVAGRIDDLSKRQAEMARKMREVREREQALAQEQEETIDAEFEVRD